MTTDPALITLNETLQDAENAAMEAAQGWAAVPGTDGVIRHRLAFAAAQLLTAATEPGNVTRSYASEKINRATADLTTIADMLRATEQVTLHPDHARRKGMDRYNATMAEGAGKAYHALTAFIRQYWGENTGTQIGIAASDAAMSICGVPGHNQALVKLMRQLSSLSVAVEPSAKDEALHLTTEYLSYFED